MRFERTSSCATFAACIALSGAAGAQELDCSDPMTQTAMNQCAYQAWQFADDDLNLAYSIAIARAKEIDVFNSESSISRRAGGADTDGVGTEEMLRRAQRAWVVFRNAACLVESDIAFGGSMQPMLYSACAEDLTRARTEQLRYFGEFN